MRLCQQRLQGALTVVLDVTLDEVSFNTALSVTAHRGEGGAAHLTLILQMRTLTEVKGPVKGLKPHNNWVLQQERQSEVRGLCLQGPPNVAEEVHLQLSS